MKSEILLYQFKPKYDFWLKFILGGLLTLTFIMGLFFLTNNKEAALILFGVTVFDALLFVTILPNRFLIYEDRLVIKLGGPLAHNIYLDEIKDVKPASSNDVFIYWGIRFATATSTVVEIVRRKGLNVIISPDDRDIFVEQLERACRLRREY